MKGYANRFAKIDLTTQTIEDYPVSDEYRKLYLGGKILVARIVYDIT